MKKKSTEVVSHYKCKHGHKFSVLTKKNQKPIDILVCVVHLCGGRAEWEGSD